MSIDLLARSFADSFAASIPHPAFHLAERKSYEIRRATTALALPDTRAKISTPG